MGCESFTLDQASGQTIGLNGISKPCKSRLPVLKTSDTTVFISMQSFYLFSDHHLSYHGLYLISCILLFTSFMSPLYSYSLPIAAYRYTHNYSFTYHFFNALLPIQISSSPLFYGTIYFITVHDTPSFITSFPLLVPSPPSPPLHPIHPSHPFPPPNRMRQWISNWLIFPGESLACYFTRLIIMTLSLAL